MEIREYNTASEHVMEIRCSIEKGDHCRIITRNNNPQDAPLVIVYNLGCDFSLRTGDDQRRRIKAFVKELRLCVGEVLEDVGNKLGIGGNVDKMPHEC